MENPDLAPDGLYDLLSKCWIQNWRDRASFAELQDDMRALMGQAGDIDGDLGKDLAEAKEKKIVKLKKPQTPPWYIGKVSKELAEKALLSASQGDFLVRVLDDETWVISVHDSKALKNFAVKLDQTTKKFMFAGMPYDTLKAAVKFLKANPFQGKTGKITLANPVKVLNPTIAPRKSSMVKPRSEVPGGETVAPTCVNSSNGRDSRRKSTERRPSSGTKPSSRERTPSTGSKSPTSAGIKSPKRSAGGSESPAPATGMISPPRRNSLNLEAD